MFLLAHAGITLGAAVVLNRLLTGHSGNGTAQRAEASAQTRGALHSIEAWAVSTSRRIDLRVLLAGSVLPDMDKVIGRLAYGAFGGRLFCHSLLFLLIIAGGGLGLYFGRHKNWLLVLASGVFMHLVLDGMWFDSRTLLWPLRGWSFPSVEQGWMQDMIHELFAAPGVYVPELAGLAMLSCFAWMLMHRGMVLDFVRSGRV